MQQLKIHSLPEVQYLIKYISTLLRVESRGADPLPVGSGMQLVNEGYGMVFGHE